MIDVKQLRIGSHVLVDGERKEVKSVSNPWIFLDDDKPYHADELDPIPLTAELLTEIGLLRELAMTMIWTTILTQRVQSEWRERDWLFRR